MLLAMLVHTEALKVNVSTGSKLGLHWAWNIDRRLHSKMLHSILHDAKLDRDTSGHLDCATERDLAVTLREVQIADRELRTLDVHWQVDFGATRQVLDVAVAAVLRSTWNRASTLFANLLFDVITTTTNVYALWVWRKSYVAAHVATLLDELAFTIVPCLEHLGRRCTTKNTRMDQTSEADAWDMTRGAIDAFEVPDSFGSVYPHVSIAPVLPKVEVKIRVLTA